MTVIIDGSGGVAGWIEEHRDLCFRFVRLSTDISGIFREHRIAFSALEQIKPLCASSTEKITIATLHIRQQIAANHYLDAMEYFLDTLDEFGYTPEHPHAVELWRPKSVEDVEQLSAGLQMDREGVDPDHVLIMSLIGYAGPTIYITMPERRNAIFLLGISLVKRLGIIHDSTAYLVAVHSMLVRNSLCSDRESSLTTDLRRTGPVCT